ncbi:MAG: FkbM family methyltransferase [Rikenellaceae bacterium]
MIFKKLYIKVIYKIIIKSKILKYLKSQDTLNEEQKEVQTFLENNPCHTYPYEFVKQYSMSGIKVLTDDSCGLKYVMSAGKRLYFKRAWSDSKIRRCYKNISLEQNPQSPHCYLTPYFNVDKDDHVMDVGCAEANFSLSIVDKVSHISLFEVDEQWIEALNMTFKPWKDKVTIINRYVSDTTDSSNITIDDYVSQGNPISFIKADVEGAEEIVLSGAKEFFKSPQKLKVAVTTYHKQQHANIIHKILTDAGLKCSYSKGYMILKNQGNLVEPYLRKGLIYATK